MKILIDNNIQHSRECSCEGGLKWSVWNDVTDMSDGTVVVFNTRWRTAVLMSAHEYGIARSHCQDTTLQRLGMIVYSGTEERREWREAYEAARRDMSYLDITVVLTERCQFGCVYCFEGARKACRTIGDDVAQAVMRIVEGGGSQLRRLRITWFGGEPMLAYDKMVQMSEMVIPYCEEHGIAYSADITTNGYALTPARIAQMVDSLKIRTYIITLDGTAKVHDKRRPLLSGRGSFDRIWSNIATLVGHGVFVLVRITIDRRNVDDVTALIDIIAEAGWAGKVCLAFCRTIDVSFTPKQTGQFIYTEREFADVEWKLVQYAHGKHLVDYGFPHAAPKGGCLRDGDIVIGPRGEVYKCLDTIGDERWVAGNVVDNIQAQQPQWLETWRSWMPDDMPGCRQCVLQPLCSGGCPHNALFGDKRHGTTMQCPDWKANYKRNIIALIDETNQTV